MAFLRGVNSNSSASDFFEFETESHEIWISINNVEKATLRYREDASTKIGRAKQRNPRILRKKFVLLLGAQSRKNSFVSRAHPAQRNIRTHSRNVSIISLSLSFVTRFCVFDLLKNLSAFYRAWSFFFHSRLRQEKNPGRKKDFHPVTFLPSVKSRSRNADNIKDSSREKFTNRLMNNM